MTTKPGPAVTPAPGDAQEKIAYESVALVETVEPHDRDRLGYHVWRWLSSRDGTIENLLRESGVRLKMPANQAVKLIRDSLAAKGINAP
jgi:hypothetical protein